VNKRLRANLIQAHRMASMWVMTVASFAAAIWLGLDAAQQAAVIKALPIPPWAVPVGVGVVGAFARIWPQKSINPPE
jgi:hypothetical protein